MEKIYLKKLFWLLLNLFNFSAFTLFKSRLRLQTGVFFVDPNWRSRLPDQQRRIFSKIDSL